MKLYIAAALAVITGCDAETSPTNAFGSTQCITSDLPQTTCRSFSSCSNDNGSWYEVGRSTFHCNGFDCTNAALELSDACPVINPFETTEPVRRVICGGGTTVTLRPGQTFQSACQNNS